MFVNPKSAVKGTWGNIRVSRSELVARKVGRRGREGFFPELSILQVLTANLPKNIRDIMLSVKQPDLDPGITRWIDIAGLSEDWQAHCEVVVFCSFVQQLVAGVYQRARGFIIEPANADDGSIPCGLTESERKLLTEDGFLGVKKVGYNEFPNDPLKTIFINHYISVENREMLMGHEFFPPLAYYLGQLKSKTDFSAEGIDPDSTRYEMRSFYAALYELQAISKLMCALIKEEGEEPAIVRADAGQKWLDQAEERLMTSFGQLNDHEKTALYQHRLIPDQLPFSIKLPV